MIVQLECQDAGLALLAAVGPGRGGPRFLPVRIDDSHHTPYNEEIR